MFDEKTRLITGCLLALLLAFPVGASQGADEPSGVKKLWNRLVGRTTDSATSKLEPAGPKATPANRRDTSAASLAKIRGPHRPPKTEPRPASKRNGCNRFGAKEDGSSKC